MVRLENEWMSLGFDPQTGSLASMVAKASGHEFLSPRPRRGGNPFGIWTDFLAPYRFTYDGSAYQDVFYSSHQLPPDPATLAKSCLRPSGGAKISVKGKALTLTWRLDGLDVKVTVELDGWTSRWAMSITNRGPEVRSVLPVFPWIDGIQLPGGAARMVALNQEGYIADLWAHVGGAYGNSFHSSAQFGCLFEEESGNALGFFIEDPSFGAKDIRYVKPGFQVRWFPDRTLASGASLSLPKTVILAYRGSWKQTAQAYGTWFRKAARPDPTPDWILDLDGYSGAWAEKKGKPYGPGASPGAMDSFEELPAAYIWRSAEALEYAFYSEGSAKPIAGAGQDLHKVEYRHTDGWNTVRADLGGIDALRRGVEQLHRNGKRVVLYIEGLIVPEESELFEHIPEARNWVVHNPDGRDQGPYTRTKFVHMCPGSAAWQDHCAQMAARLVRESGVDGIRLDSLAFYFWPCYNPTHKHASPFDYNLWVRELYAKVADAVKAVRPDALLATESPVDLAAVRFNYSLHQMVGNMNEYVARDTAPLRVALPDYVTVQWTGGAVAQTLRLLPDANRPGSDSEAGRLAALWFPVHQAVKATLARGDAATPNPLSSCPDMACRWVRAEREDVILGVRPEAAHRDGDPVLLKKDPIHATITAPLGYRPQALYLYDVEKQTTAAVPFTEDARGISFETTAGWFAAVAYRGTGDRPVLLTGDGEAKPGGRVALLVDAPAVGRPIEVAVEPVGLAGARGVRVAANSVATLEIPAGAQPGTYWVTARGRGLRPTARFIRVLD